MLPSKSSAAAAAAGSPSFSIFPNVDDLPFENIYLKNNQEEEREWKEEEEMKKNKKEKKKTPESFESADKLHHTIIVSNTSI